MDPRFWYGFGTNVIGSFLRAFFFLFLVDVHAVMMEGRASPMLDLDLKFWANIVTTDIIQTYKH
jgi:hypothetical protein